MIKPITPQEAKNSPLAKKPVHPKMIEAFNILIAQRMQYLRVINIKQNEVIEKFMELTEDTYTRNEILANNWLDIEAHYREAGWIVVYDKPSYSQTYQAYFTFDPQE